MTKTSRHNLKDVWIYCDRMSFTDTDFSNMCCVPRSKSSDSPLDKRRDSILNRQLREWKKSEDKTIKLLLLGCGESGKSTVSKQMKIIHINGFSDSERLKMVKNIRKNVRDSILTILGAMHNLGIKLEDKKLQPSVDWIMQNCIKEEFNYPEVFYEHVNQLWRDEGVQKCYQRSNEYQLIDSAKYFIERTKEIRCTDYNPSDQDMLRCRVLTNSIHTIDFAVKDRHSAVHFNVYDVGGQRGQRRKWLQMFDSITAIIFVLDCSCYDLYLREDDTRNRMLEACDLFHQLWNNRWLRRVPMILFINKIDVLAEKVNSGHTLDQFVQTVSPDNPFYKYFQPFREYFKSDCVKESEMKEFVDSFPLGNVVEEIKKSQSTLSLTGMSKRRSRQISLVHHVGTEVVKTVIFIKRVFMEIINETRKDEFGGDWHCHHDCEYYYTCAVDTQQIKKVLDSCRSLIIKKHLHGWGLSV